MFHFEQTNAYIHKAHNLIMESKKSKTIDWFKEPEKSLEEVQAEVKQATLNFAQRGARKY